MAAALPCEWLESVLHMELAQGGLLSLGFTLPTLPEPMVVGFML